MSAPRVAVIAIHGVGDHQPFDMAKSVSSLLSDLEDLDQGRRIPRYSPFTEHMIRVNVAPVNVTGRGFANEVAGKPGQNISEDRSWGPMGALYDSGIKVDHAANACPDSLDHLFLEGQLAKYKGDGPEETYEALRLEGKRFANAQVCAAAMLAWPIPLLNLLMLTFGLGVFADAMLVKFSTRAQAMATVIALLAGLAGACGVAMRRSGKWSTTSYRLPVLAFLTLTAGIVATLFFLKRGAGLRAWREGIEGIATGLTELAAFALLWAIVGAYDKRRPGTKRAFGVVIAVVAAASLALSSRFIPPSSNFVAMVFLVRLIEISFLILLVAFFLFWVTILWAFITGFLAVRATPRHLPNEADRAARTNWTARFTIALPSVLFLLLTFALWSGLMNVSMSLLPHDPSINDANCPAQSVRAPRSLGSVKALCVSPLIPMGAKPRTIRTWTEQTLAQAGIGFIPFLLLLVCIAALISLWALAPSVLDEISPPRGPIPDLQKESTALGKWLDDGFRFMRWAGRVLYIAVLLFPSGIVLAWLYDRHGDWPLVQAYSALAIPFSWSLGAIVAGAAIGVLGFGGRLS